MFPMPLKATYAASKRFLLDFATALRQELKDEDVNVLTLCPGGLATIPEVMKAIASQGFWGVVTTNPMERVARRTLDRALHGRSRYVPGVLNRSLMRLGKFVPQECVANMVYMRWRHSQSKWLVSHSK